MTITYKEKVSSKDITFLLKNFKLLAHANSRTDKPCWSTGPYIITYIKDGKSNLNCVGSWRLTVSITHWQFVLSLKPSPPPKKNFMIPLPGIKGSYV